MAHVGAWQYSDLSPFESEEISQCDDGDFDILHFTPGLVHAAQTPLYQDGYPFHNPFSPTNHANRTTTTYNVHSGIPLSAPVSGYWPYEDGLAGQPAIQDPSGGVHVDGSDIYGYRAAAETFLSHYPFDFPAPALVSYVQDHTQPFALYQPKASSSPMMAQGDGRVAFFTHNHSTMIQVQSGLSGLHMSNPKPPQTISEKSWELISRPGSTIYSSSSGKVLTYEADTTNSGSSSQGLDEVQIKNTEPNPKTSRPPRSKPFIEKDSQDTQLKPGKMRPHTAERAPKSRVSKRQGKLNPQQRSKAAEMRKAGRCFRCALYKLGCDLGEPCGNCSKVLNSARSFLEPCFRSDLKSIKLVRQCNGRFAQEMAGFRKYRWAELDNTPSRMVIDWILPANVPVRVTSMNVPIRRYIPEQSDPVDTTAFHFNVNGNVGRIELPPYAISDTGQLINIVDEFLYSAQSEVELWIHQRFRNDPVKSATFVEACRYRDQNNSSLIAKAIRMQCGAIMSQGCGVARDCADIGLKFIDYKKLGHSTYEAYNREFDRPLPQAMGHQFDVAILLRINEWQKDFLKDLKTKIFTSGPKPWYEIFLACFVLLSNLEYIYGGALAYIQTKLSTDLESQVSFVVRQQTVKWDSAARVLLQHYRCVARGHIPFLNPRLDPEELRAGGFDEETILYLLKVVQLLETEAQSPYGSISPSIDACAPHCWSRLLFSEAPVP